ncbi:hypothetical protein PMV46_15215, partial [Eggerthella lenta]
DDGLHERVVEAARDDADRHVGREVVEEKCKMNSQCNIYTCILNRYGMVGEVNFWRRGMRSCKMYYDRIVYCGKMLVQESGKEKEATKRGCRKRRRGKD